MSGGRRRRFGSKRSVKPAVAPHRGAAGSIEKVRLRPGSWPGFTAGPRALRGGLRRARNRHRPGDSSGCHVHSTPQGSNVGSPWHQPGEGVWPPPPADPARGRMCGRCFVGRGLSKRAHSTLAGLTGWPVGRVFPGFRPGLPTFNPCGIVVDGGLLCGWFAAANGARATGSTTAAALLPLMPRLARTGFPTGQQLLEGQAPQIRPLCGVGPGLFCPSPPGFTQGYPYSTRGAGRVKPISLDRIFGLPGWQDPMVPPITAGLRKNFGTV